MLKKDTSCSSYSRTQRSRLTMVKQSFIAIAITAFTTSVSAGAPQLPIKFPTDVKQSCATSSTEFASWFDSGEVTKNGLVDAANSTGTFTSDCDFYKWGSQMFLWLSSPANGDKGTYTFNQPGFYEVSPLNDSGSRTFIKEVAGKGGLSSIALRATKKDGSELESGQADGNALISNKNDVVFYGLHANDVYAYYRSEEANGDFESPNSLFDNFPTTADDVTQISNLLPSNQEPISDANALAMELKTSWVEAQSVDDISQYITITTEVPIYSKNSTNTIWTETTETESKKLALVGMHIVGTVTGHPEMVWTTIEHVNNAPDKAYYYLTQSTPSQISTFGFDGSPVSGEWSFNATPANNIDEVTPTASYNVPTSSEPAQIKTELFETIYIEGSKTEKPLPIVAATVVRLNPWGNVSSSSNGSEKIKIAQSNTDLVSLNSSVISALANKNDVRANYIQIGGIWDKHGSIPTSGDVSNLAGGLYLSNTTMETFHQYPDKNNGFQTTNCFACHNVTKPVQNMQCLGGKMIPQKDYDTSHIFCAIEPIWTNPITNKSSHKEN